MTSPQPMTDAIPLLSPTPTIGRNNARDIRQFLLQGLMFAPGASQFTRRGIIHRGWRDPVDGTPYELKVLESGPGPNVLVNTGLFVVHRGAIGAVVDEGPYFGGSMGRTTIALNLPAASGANSRYDGVFARIVDRNIAADAGLSPLQGPYVEVISGALGALNFGGTPGAAGAPPATPDGYLPLAFIERAINDNVVSQAEIKDVRRSAFLVGTPRVLTAWDLANIATDTGYVNGEERFRPAAAPYPAFLDRWDGAAWRGTQSTILDTVVGPSPAILGINTITLLLTKTIPDPGFPYRIRVGATVGYDSDANALGEASIRFTNTAGAAIGLLGEDPLFAGTGSGSANKKRQVVMAARPTSVIASGATTIVLCLRRLSGGSQLGALLNISELYTEVVPAT